MHQTATMTPLPTRTGPRAAILALLAAVMIATRLHLPALSTHIGALPDASWAVFFMAGFYLRGWSRWAFPLFMALAVGVDYAVITGQGLEFWKHYCVSPAYWCLVPAYLALWLGGSLTARAAVRLRQERTLGVAVVAAQRLEHDLQPGLAFGMLRAGVVAQAGRVGQDDHGAASRRRWSHSTSPAPSARASTRASTNSRSESRLR